MTNQHYAAIVACTLMVAVVPAAAADISGHWEGVAWGSGGFCTQANVSIVIAKEAAGKVDVKLFGKGTSTLLSFPITLAADDSYKTVYDSITVSGKLTDVDGTFNYNNTRGCHYSGSVKKAPG